MAWYDKLKFNDDKNTLNEIATYIQTETPVIGPNFTPEPEEEWIWVEGYKGVDQNMQGYGGFQYELGVEYSVEGEVRECRNGLHFSVSLEDAFHYKDRLTHRFFKVKAYVRKRDFINYGNHVRDLLSPYSYSIHGRIDKLAAQKIVLVEEITETEEMLRKIKQEYPDVNTFDDVKQVREYGYDKFRKDKYRQKLSKYFSELFVEIFIDRFYDDQLELKTNEIIAYMEEGVSKDVAIYLVMK